MQNSYSCIRGNGHRVTGVYLPTVLKAQECGAILIRLYKNNRSTFSIGTSLFSHIFLQDLYILCISIYFKSEVPILKVSQTMVQVHMLESISLHLLVGFKDMHSAYGSAIYFPPIWANLCKCMYIVESAPNSLTQYSFQTKKHSTVSSFLNQS